MHAFQLLTGSAMLPAKKAKTDLAAIRSTLAAMPWASSVQSLAGLRPPTDAALDDFDWQCNEWACVSVATHGKVKKSHDHDWPVGKVFGHRCLLDETQSYEELRIEKISWALGAFELGAQEASGRPRKYVTYVQPDVTKDCFVISRGVARVSHQRALDEGLPLREVLSAMVSDVYCTVRVKGRLCMHHLEHEGRIVDAELRRAGLGQQFWQEACRNGFCSMDPHLWQWIFDTRGPALKSKAVGFDKIVTQLLGATALRRQAAEQRWLVTQKLHQQVRKHKAAMQQILEAQSTTSQLASPSDISEVPQTQANALPAHVRMIVVGSHDVLREIGGNRNIPQALFHRKTYC